MTLLQYDPVIQKTMYSIPTNEKLIKNTICKHCSSDFPITDKDLEFYDKISPIFSGRKYHIPTPTLCPDCRQQRRLSFRNERKLYKRKCDATGQDMVSIYSPESLYTVYHQDYWWSDGWNPMDYGREFDFDRSFFSQYEELIKKSPVMTLIVKGNLNSDFTNYSGNNKNCYLLFNADINEDCMFSTTGFYNKTCVDCVNIHDSELCYDSIDIKKSFQCFYGNNLSNCFFCYYCTNCFGCENCFLCIGLNNRKYCFLNEPYTKDEYELLIKDFGKKNMFFKKYKQLCLEAIYKTYNGFNIQKSTGDYLYNCNNIGSSFEMYDSENCKFCLGLHHSNNCYDVTFFGIENMENIYEGNAIGIHSININFSSNIVNGNSNILYSYFIYNNCSNLFGCTGLRNKSYCILNKQYTREEYESLVPKIIEHMMKTGEWGEFFPSSLSPFGYNETVAAEYYPLTRSEAIQDGIFNWSDYEAPFPKVEKVIDVEGMKKLPENIADIPDDILNWALTCEVSGKPYRIIKQELEFYRKHALPIPRRHPDQRHLDRMALRNPRRLYERVCDSNTCEENYKKKGIYKEEEFGSNMRSGREGKRMITTYAPEREEIVYCEVCYEREVG